MQFKVTKQFPNTKEITLKEYNKKEEAEKCIQEKLLEDAQFKLQTTYRLYDDLDFLLKEYKVDKTIVAASSQTDIPSGQSGKSQSFNPSPFSAKPLPGGMPRSGFQEVDKEEKDKQK